jgi:hypothetical protein
MKMLDSGLRCKKNITLHSFTPTFFPLGGWFGTVEDARASTGVYRSAFYGESCSGAGSSLLLYNREFHSC